MLTFTEEEVVRRALLDVLGHAPETSNEKHRTRRKSRNGLHLKKSNQRNASRKAYVEPPILRFSIVDRPSSLTVSVCWSDPRYGRHDEQTWRMGRARFASCCLLTGGAIRHGDKVFRPRARAGVHPDRDRMILASAVEGFCPT
jgi:hypothetical protein